MELQKVITEKIPGVDVSGITDEEFIRRVHLAGGAIKKEKERRKIIGKIGPDVPHIEWTINIIDKLRKSMKGEKYIYIDSRPDVVIIEIRNDRTYGTVATIAKHTNKYIAYLQNNQRVLEEKEYAYNANMDDIVLYVANHINK